MGRLLDEAINKTPLAFIATRRLRSIYAYGVRLHWRRSVTWHWGGLRHTQPVELQMYGLLRILEGLSFPLRLNVILRTDYLTSQLVIAEKWGRDKERGVLKHTLKRDVSAWIRSAKLWQQFRCGMREFHTELESAELKTIERELDDLLYSYPSPFGNGDQLIESGDPLPFGLGEEDA